MNTASVPAKAVLIARKIIQFGRRECHYIGYAMSEPVDLAFGAAVLAAALFASGHAVIYKREARSAALWAILIWVMPAVGPILYLLMGVNRVQRRAARLRADMVRHRTDPQVAPGEPPGTHLAPLARMLN